MRPFRVRPARVATFAVVALAALGCTPQAAPPTRTPTAEMARYCLEEPLRAYTAGTDDGVAWALAENVLYLHFLSAAPIAIPASAPACDQEWRLVGLAGAVEPVLSSSYSAVTTPAGASHGFVLGFAAGAEVIGRLEFLLACAAVQAAGSDPDAECATAGAVIAFGPVSSPAMSLLWPEDEQLIEWLANQPD